MHTMRGKTAGDLTEAEVRDMALRYVCRREYGIEELRQKLCFRGVGSGLAEKVVGDLVDENLVSDQRFTEMYVRTRIRQMYGPLKIRGELRGKGVSDFLIAEAMPSDQEAWFDTATQWVAKKNPSDLDFAGRAKLHRSLMYRGFTHEQANTAIDRISHQ